MNGTLFRYSCRKVFPLWLIFTVLMSLYAFAVVRMYDPDAGAALIKLTDSLPQTMTILGMKNDTNTFTAFIVNYLYGMLMLALPMVFTVIISVQLMAHHVSNGTMSYLLASPNSRKRIVATQRNVLIVTLLLMLAVCCIVTIGLCEYFYPHQLDILPFLILTACVFALHLAFAGMCYFFSCRNNSTVGALIVNAVACLLFYTIRLLANLGGSLSYLRFITPYTLINPTGILQMDVKACLLPLILLVIAMILFALANRSFQKKTMPF